MIEHRVVSYRKYWKSAKVNNAKKVGILCRRRVTAYTLFIGFTKPTVSMHMVNC